MTSSPNRHQKTAALLFGIGLLVLFVALGSESAFNLRSLHPRGSTQIVIFTGLSLVVFLLLITLLILLLRNILKLYADQKSRAMGARLRTRMMLGALLLSSAPVVTMFLFSYILMNRSIDRWFSQPVTDLHEDADGMAEQLQHYATENARAEADSLAQEPEISAAFAKGGKDSVQSEILGALRDHKVTLQGGFALVFQDGNLLSSYHAPPAQAAMTLLVDGKILPAGPDGADFAQTLLQVAQRTDEPILRVPVTDFGEPDPYVVAAAPVHGGGIILVGLPLPQELPGTIQRIREGTRDYFALGRARRGVRSTFLLVLTLLTTAIFFASSWLALFLSRQITRPVESIADAMAEIASGHYSFRLPAITTNELGTLATSFNHMAADLETSRNRLDASRTDLSRANLALEARRVEIETLLDTIPLAVLSLSLDLRIVHSNRAFLELLAPSTQGEITGHALAEFIPEEAMPEVQRLLRRGHRMGLASKEVSVHGPQRLLNLSITVASLERHGYILVMEDVTDLLRAQKQVAWKEVAQRVAHEIKNPLTPISIAAERVRRYADRGTLAENSAKVRESTDVIVRSVEVLRQLVDQFALLAQFPAAQLRPMDLNRVIEDTLMLFAGRVEDMRIFRDLDPALPPVNGDPRALERALANLIDNAAEAMQNSLHRELTVQTRLNDAGTMAEIILSDTGSGISDEVREHLFLPWFSTKQRGSGLGLAITSQVIQEHNGSIRAEQNQPLGARFILELPLAEAGAVLDAPAASPVTATETTPA
jgi:nitrogen fixation/metabolism regulation signal transduction histidine kinase